MTKRTMKDGTAKMTRAELQALTDIRAAFSREEQ